MLVDRALEKARRVDAVFVHGETKVQTLAFADHVVLFASTRGGLQDSTGAFLREMSFSSIRTYASKCASLSLVADAVRKQYACNGVEFLGILPFRVFVW